MTVNDIESFIQRHIHAGRMAQDVNSIIAHSPRFAGTENEWRAAEYIEKTFRSTGLEVIVDKVHGVNAWVHKDTRVRILEPVERELNGIAILGSAATPPEGITAEVVYIGRGRLEDLENIDVTNKLVFRDPPRALKLDNSSDETAPQGLTETLIASGALGFIEYARLKGNILQTDLLSGPEGLTIPAVALTYEDGQVIKELLREWYALPDWYKRTQDRIPVVLNIKVDTDSKPSFGKNVIAVIPGNKHPEEKVVLVAHHDNAFGPGACDNATAVAVNLECARVLSQLPPAHRTIEFVSVTGEEYGEFGSGAYVDQYVKPNPGLYKGALVLDIIGNGDHLYYITESICLGKLVKNSPSINGLIEIVCDSLGYVIEGTPLEFASDDGPFILAGVETSYLAKLISTSWPWLHTYMDDFRVVDINGLKVVAEISAMTVWRLANQP
jgi:aminopeptidase YwaD